MAWLRRGTWHPTRGTWVPTLLAVQIVFLGQALLRGADYVRTTDYTPPDLASLVTYVPLWVWGFAFAGMAALALAGIAGHWGAAVAVGHMGVAVTYLCVGAALLQAHHTESWPRVISGMAVFAVGAVVAHQRPDDPRAFLVLRMVAVAFLIAGTLGVIDGMGRGFRTATGQLAGAVIHGILGLAVLRIVTRQRIRERLDEP
jgi:hypothetical protein